MKLKTLLVKVDYVLLHCNNCSSWFRCIYLLWFDGIFFNGEIRKSHEELGYDVHFRDTSIAAMYSSK